MSQLFINIPFESLEHLHVMAQFMSTLLAIDGNIKAVGAGIAALGVLGTGVGQGYATGKALTALGKNPEAEKKIRTLFILGMALTESAAIYALLLGIIIAFAV